MNLRHALASFAAALVLAACSTSPTRPAAEPSATESATQTKTLSTENPAVLEAHTPTPPCAPSLADCPLEGCGGGDNRDPITNRQKNRSSVPSDPLVLSVGQFKQRFKELADIGTKRENLSAQDQATLDTDEAQAVTLDGFVLDDRQEGPESCACYVANALDFHIWLASTRTASKAKAIVVEITPRIFDTTDPSVGAVMSRLKQDKTHVRVTGWPMFDPLHPDQIGQSRYTRWEVHPVVDIQEKVGGAWKSVFP